MNLTGLFLAGAVSLLAAGAHAEGGVHGRPAAASEMTTKAQPTTHPEDTRGPRTGKLSGYLSHDGLVDSLMLLGPAPEAGSLTALGDEEIRAAARKLRGTPRGKVAVRDADYTGAGITDPFACTIGVNINEKSTPNLSMLLRRTLVDSSLATATAKAKYHRVRPYVAIKDAGTCYPENEEQLRNDGSYPSGHASYGWAWALILTEALPSEANAILKRGYEFGQSRVICGYHWQSDVNAGRLVGAGVVAQLHANPEFLAQLAEAKKEIAAARASGANKPDCSIDAAAAHH